jgi:hypothetical protein
MRCIIPARECRGAGRERECRVVRFASTRRSSPRLKAALEGSSALVHPPPGLARSHHPRPGVVTHLHGTSSALVLALRRGFFRVPAPSLGVEHPDGHGVRGGLRVEHPDGHGVRGGLGVEHPDGHGVRGGLRVEHPDGHGVRGGLRVEHPDGHGVRGGLGVPLPASVSLCQRYRLPLGDPLSASVSLCQRYRLPLGDPLPASVSVSFIRALLWEPPCRPERACP